MSFGLSWIARALRARRLSARTMAEAYGARMERKRNRAEWPWPTAYARKGASPST